MGGENTQIFFVVSHFFNSRNAAGAIPCLSLNQRWRVEGVPNAERSAISFTDRGVCRRRRSACSPEQRLILDEVLSFPPEAYPLLRAAIEQVRRKLAKKPPEK